MRSIYGKIVIFAALGGGLALVFLDPASEKPISVAFPAVSLQAHGPSGMSDADGGAKGESKTRAPALPERPAWGELRAEFFGSQSWQASAPKVIAAPVVPTAPPLPYRFAGKLVQDGKLQVFLSKGDAAIPVKQGEILDGMYRVEAIGEDRITLVHLALGLRENIPVNSILQSPNTYVTGAGAAAPAGGTQAGPGTIPGASVIASAADAPDKKTGSKPAQLLWVGPRQVKLGSSFSVVLRVTSEQPVRASPIQIKFDPGLLETVAVKAGGFFGKGDRDFSYRVNPDGTIFVGASNPGPESAADAEFLVLAFKPIKPGAVAEISIASLNLQGAAGRAIAHDTIAAYRVAVTP
ncbi:MAG: hypothetical protein HY848_01575 [Betaproteobacteria bacterium]|nr:hypothetical protein [Betaproteobacteria bacterium]